MSKGYCNMQNVHQFCHQKFVFRGGGLHFKQVDIESRPRVLTRRYIRICWWALAPAADRSTACTRRPQGAQQQTICTPLAQCCWRSWDRKTDRRTDTRVLHNTTTIMSFLTMTRVRLNWKLNKTLKTIRKSAEINVEIALQKITENQ